MSPCLFGVQQEAHSGHLLQLLGASGLPLDQADLWRMMVVVTRWRKLSHSQSFAGIPSERDSRILWQTLVAATLAWSLTVGLRHLWAIEGCPLRCPLSNKRPAKGHCHNRLRQPEPDFHQKQHCEVQVQVDQSNRGQRRINWMNMRKWIPC